MVHALFSAVFFVLQGSLIAAQKSISQNTFILEFRSLHELPNSIVLEEFLQSTFNLQSENAISVEIDNYTKCVSVKLVSKLLAENVVNSTEG